MNLTTHIEQRLESRGILLMTHLIVGYPSLDANRRMLEIMDAADVDLVELQMPFSEPMADGPVFVRANEEALRGGMNLEGYFDFMATAARLFRFPLLMMGYYNTVFRLGHEPFCRRLAVNGGSGFILPDLPCEEYGDLTRQGEVWQLSPIMLMAPTNTAERLVEIGRIARGFVYGVARKGVTGKATQVDQEIDGFVARCRQATDLPLALGFGLSQRQDLRRLQGRVEMAVVGSALLRKWEEGGETAYTSLLEDLAAGRY